MTERKANAAAEAAAMQRTADRLIRQVSDLLINRGELSSLAVNHPPGSDWVAAPVERLAGKWFQFGTFMDGGSHYAWPTSLDWGTNPVRTFESFCHSLNGLLVSQSSRLPDSLAGWLRGNSADPLARWVWFVSGYAITPLPRRRPRTRRKCWGNDGTSYYDADILETLRKGMPEVWRLRMPPDASCWLIRVADLLQTTIDAVEYLAELSYETSPPATVATTTPRLTNPPGRNPREITAEEKRIQTAWGSKQYRTRFDLDRALGKPEGYSAMILERLRKKMERERKKSG